MNKLIKEVEFGKYNFKIAINREIALKVSDEFPEFIVYILDKDDEVTDMKTAVMNGKLKELLEKTDYITSQCGKIVEFALPFMLKEADSKENADEIINYAIENDAYELFSQKIWEFILLGFTNNGEVKTPKVSLQMK